MLISTNREKAEWQLAVQAIARLGRVHSGQCWPVSVFLHTHFCKETFGVRLPASVSMPGLRCRILALIVLASAGLMSSEAQAQNYSAFFNATINSGTYWKLNGNNVTPLNYPVTSTTLDYQFGFASATSPIAITISGTSLPNGVRTNTFSITAIESVYLVQPINGNGKHATSLTATLTANASTTRYNGSSDTAWSTVRSPLGYSAGNFGNADFLRMDTSANWNRTTPTLNPRYGTFDFTNVHSSGNGSIQLGAHVRGVDGNGNVATFWVRFTPSNPTNPNAQTPEPQAVILWCGMALGLAASCWWARRRQLELA